MILDFLDYAGVAVFAATGALAASRKEVDLIGFIFFASVTGIGGGTLRDLVLGHAPVFWIENPTYLLVCVGIALFVYATAHMVESRYKILLWLDAVGLASYSVMGAAKGLDATGSPAVAMVTGMLTATFGGILRDLLAQEPSVLLRQEIYIAAALVGAAVYTVSTGLGLALPLASTIAVAAAFLTRGGAIRFGWKLPRYRSRAGRDPKDIS